MSIDQFHGPSKPHMPTYDHHDFPEQLKDESRKLLDYSTNVDFEFLEDIGKSSGTNLIPEYNGYNNKLARESGRSITNKTQVWFKPMIDLTPSDPSCIKTAMLLAVRETQNIIVDNLTLCSLQTSSYIKLLLMFHGFIQICSRKHNLSFD